MYDFHYNFIKKNFDANLLFTDTDSLTYEIKSEDIMKNFLNTSTCLTLVNINQNFFIQLTNYILSEYNKESNKAKGVNIAIEFNEYKNILLNTK